MGEEEEDGDEDEAMISAVVSREVYVLRRVRG
jgi:hypothetical protein